jgi:catechol 2,3-dioxygenase-like lactoylglutathione lyase family enzyme
MPGPADATEVSVTMPHAGMEHVALTGVHDVAVGVQDLQRSIKFYSRVFGFRIAEGARGAAPGGVRMSTRDVRLALNGHAGATLASTRRWTFVVDDLDEVREAIWNLGVAPVEDGVASEPDPVSRRRRRLIICDADGNQIELIERLSVGARGVIPPHYLRGNRRTVRGPSRSSRHNRRTKS